MGKECLPLPSLPAPPIGEAEEERVGVRVQEEGEEERVGECECKKKNKKSGWKSEWQRERGV